MERVSDERLENIINILNDDGWVTHWMVINIKEAITELIERRKADESPDYSTKTQPSPMGLYRCNKGRRHGASK